MTTIRKKPVEVEAWPVRELNQAAEHDWKALPGAVAADYENPKGQGGWVFGALVTDRDPRCVEAWPECESGKYDPRCCRFPKSCSCSRERRGIYVPTLEGNLFAAPDDWIIQGVKGEFYPIKPDILLTHDLPPRSTQGFKCPLPGGEARADRDKSDRCQLGTPSRGDSLRRDGQAGRAYPSRATGDGHHV